MPMKNVSIEVATHEEAIASPMSTRLREFNNRVVGTEHYQGIGVWLNAKDAAGKVVGGFRGDIFFDWLFVHALFVDEPIRGQGLGTELLIEGEALAKSKGALHVRLETFEWQAPKFYPKLGYRLQTQFANYYREYSLYMFVKDL
jgi:GNAT superfamily N-acetyltransferase